MGLWRSLAGVYRIKIISASPADMLTAVNAKGLQLFDIHYIDDLRIIGNVYRRDLNKVITTLQRRGAEVKITGREGVFWTLTSLMKRPVLMAGVLILMLAVLYLPTRVLFVEVDGNTHIPSRYIVEQAQRCGIGFGASRREVRSERMKNALLAEIPELQWAGVNTYGCVAVISVRERSDVIQEAEQPQVNSIVATQDGIIREITVIQGNPLCKVGQAVKKGQVLISGYTDCGISIKAGRSEGEIVAQTMHVLQVVTPVSPVRRGEIVKEDAKYALRIGKNIINFCKDSGISDVTCVKMYKEIPLTLPGGFELPVSVLKTRYIHCDDTQVYNDEADTYIWMKDSTEDYLTEQMLAGKILLSDEEIELTDDVCILSGRYACLENIGQIRYEEKLTDAGKGN